MRSCCSATGWRARGKAGASAARCGAMRACATGCRQRDRLYLAAECAQRVGRAPTRRCSRLARAACGSAQLGAQPTVAGDGPSGSPHPTMVSRTVGPPPGAIPPHAPRPRAPGSGRGCRPLQSSLTSSSHHLSRRSWTPRSAKFRAAAAAMPGQRSSCGGLDSLFAVRSADRRSPSRELRIQAVLSMPN